jgi:hypothetical protein
MAEFDQLERELTAELSKVGAAARPPSDAWERFARRLDHDPPRADLPTHSTPAGRRINDGRPPHETEIIMRSNDTVQPSRRWYILGAAAGLIAIAVVAIGLAARDTDPPAPAPAATVPAPAPTPIELIGADGDAEAIEAFEAIADAFEAFNTGDALGWATAREASGLDPTDPADSELEYVAAAHAAGARYDVSSCEYGGLLSGGDESDGSVTGHRFVCVTTMTDAFTTAAGIDFHERFKWLVADGRVVDAVSTHEDLTILRTFMNSLGTWVRNEHPDTAFTTIDFWNYPLADEVPAVLELIDEFVASDDRWPLAG